MADNVNPQAVLFCNSKARVFAEILLASIKTARQFIADYDAQGGTTLFPATADNIADGSDVDGRPRVTNNGVRALYQAATDLVTWADTGTPTRDAKLRSFTNKGEARF